MCFVAEDVFVSLLRVVFWRLKSLSSLFVCLSEEEKSPFLIFLIFLLSVSSLSVLHHNKNKRSLKDDDVFVFFSRDGQTNNCCEENYCD